MAKVKNKVKDLEKISKKSSTAIFGSNNTLEKEADQIKDIIRTTVKSTVDRYGKYTNDRPITYFSELNISKLFADNLKEQKKEKSKEDPDILFKRFMTEEQGGQAETLLQKESDRVQLYGMYRSIYENIPECAQGVDVYKDNIMSPDDFTKMVFDIVYDNSNDEDLQQKIEERLSEISEKYDLDEVADEVISNALVYGDSYVAAFSLEKELQYMMNDPAMAGILNEDTLRLIDEDAIFRTVEKDDVDREFLMEAFDGVYFGDEKNFTEEHMTESVMNMINENVVIGSKKEFLMERFFADKEKKEQGDLATAIERFNSGSSGSSTKKKKVDTKPMFINGSSIKVFDPANVVELKVDNTTYGFYVIEKNDKLTSGPAYGKENDGEGSLVSRNMQPVLNNGRFSTDFNNFSADKVSDPKADLISKIFLNTLSKKLNKDFIRHNKEMKEFIFSLVKQNYILKKGIKITFIPPNEMIAINVPPVFRKITLFARLYMATLINNLLINMGRGHDKRAIYVEMGLDGNYEEAIQRTIQSMKTKEFKMDSCADFNTVLRLNPGKFDDYYIPQFNGSRPIEIDTLPGMDREMTNDFTEFLKNSMLSGMGIPVNLIDDSHDVDFARTLSARNANFVRAIIRYQKKFTTPFSKLMRILYKNEYQFNQDDHSNELSMVVLSDIHVKFPSPATLNMSNITEQIQIVDSNSDFIINNIFPSAQGLYEEQKLKLKAKIAQDLIPSIDWEKYQGYAEEIKREMVRDGLEAPPAPDDGMGDMAGY